MKTRTRYVQPFGNGLLRPARSLGLAALLLFAVASSVVGAGGQSWINVPAANLEGLEEPVERQLATLREYAAARVADPDVTAAEAAEAVGELGRHYHAYRLNEAAEACYAIARRLAPNSFRWPYLTGYLYQTGGRLEEAAVQYEKALNIVPDVPPALIRIGLTYIELNRLEEAETVLSRAYELDPSASAALAALGQLFLSTGRNEDAVKALEKALELEQAATLLYYPLGQAYRALGDMEKAREALAQRGEVGVRPADPEIDGLEALTTGERVHLLRGRSAFEAGRFEEAEEEFRRAVAAKPDSVRAKVNLASALSESGKLEEATATLEEVVEIAPGNGTALFNLGSIWQRRGDEEKAAEWFAKAVSYEPRDVEMRLRLAGSLQRLKRFEEALPHYSRAVALEAGTEDAWVGEADVLAALGRYEEALTRLETANQVMPAAGRVAFALARMLASCPDPAVRDGGRALQLALRVHQAQPTLTSSQLVAQSYAELGRCSEAAEWQSRLVDDARASGANDAATVLDVVRERYAAGPPCRPPIASDLP